MSCLHWLFGDDDEKQDYSSFKNEGTGIACPSCGEELHETNPDELLLSSPPRKKVHCNFCKSKYTIAV